MFEFTKPILDVIDKICSEMVFDYHNGGIKTGRVYKLHPAYYTQLYPESNPSDIFCSFICYRPQTFIDNAKIKPVGTEPTSSINILRFAIEGAIEEILDVDDFTLDYHEQFEYIEYTADRVPMKSHRAAFVISIKNNAIKDLLDKDLINSVVNDIGSASKWESVKLIKELISAVVKSGETRLNHYGK